LAELDSSVNLPRAETWLAMGTPAGIPLPQPAAPSRPADVPLEALESCFEAALTGLAVAFQPIVDARDHLLIGQEALMRSAHPALPDPTTMLEAAERLHRVDRLGREIRRQVASRLSGAPADVGLIFVNLHALELLDRSLSSPYSPLGKLRHQIVLEITERVSLATVADARYRVAELREMGYRIAIDDLGAGHSRMNRFTLRDTDFVKLDMSLVRDLDKHPRRQKLVATIISMCREQGIHVVGEGVETEAERQVLVQLGCDLLQGYLIAHPHRDLARPAPQVPR
jgi:EAL domain-containing protein (putative c-di-GMP-specific phosphodiesterase class I)